MSESKYLYVETDIRDQWKPLQIPPDCSGAAILIRSDERPVRFLLEECSPGSVVTAEEIRKWSARVQARVASTPVRTAPVEFSFGKVSGCWLSIIICTRNRSQDLRKCLAGLSNLNGGELLNPSRYEIIVVDNAPADDESQKVVRNFPGIRYVKEPRVGLSIARNRGAAEATGALLAYLDDDAVVDRFWLKGLQEAWAANPGAGGFSGPILPLELVSKAQILFETRGGYGHYFQSRTWQQPASDHSEVPCPDGVFGAGANMVVSREILQSLGGFDNALGAGTTTMGGEDIDMFFRVVRAGHAWVYESGMTVFHMHRREYEQLRKQMYSWGVGYMAWLTKTAQHDAPLRRKLQKLLVKKMIRRTLGIFASLLGLRGYPWPADLAWAEVLGSWRGIFAYNRSLQNLR